MGLSSNSLQEIVESVKGISSSPQILPKLSAILNDTDSDLDEAVKLIKMDIGINGQVLKFANSSYYRRGAAVDSLEVAIQRLGFNHVHQLVMIAAAKSVFNCRMKVYKGQDEGLFETSIACGELMSALSTPLGLGDRDAAYTIGLFHAIGKIIIDNYFADKGILIFNQQTVHSTMEEERKLLGFDHAEAGAELLTKWRFSDYIVFPVRHQLSERAKHPTNKSTSALSLAAFVAEDMVSEPFDRPAKLKKFAEHFPAIYEALGLDHESLEFALMEAANNFERSLKLIRSVS
jgi:putative nucleotidyltransferase with HDIG domain